MPSYLRYRILFHGIWILIAWCAVPAWAQSRGAIRRVDWHNFTYQPHCLGNAEQIQVKNGEYSRGRVDDRDAVAAVGLSAVECERADVGEGIDPGLLLDLVEALELQVRAMGGDVSPHRGGDRGLDGALARFG